MKKLTFIIFLLVGIVPFAQADEQIPEAVYVALDHLNEYLIYPMALEDEGVEWDWQLITVSDIGDNCRERVDTSAPMPDVIYDITFYRLAETYHYRVSPDLQLVVRCVDFVDVPENTVPAVADALADLNRRIHANLSTNDIPWQWQAIQFDDYTLDCPILTPPDSTFDRSVDGYIVTFRVLGQTWSYHVSADRLIVILCQPEQETDT